MSVINRYHHRGNCPALSVDITRKSAYGNPYRIGVNGNRSQVLAKYRQHLLAKIDKDWGFRLAVRGLYGKDLCCVCAPLPCHGDILEEVAEMLYARREEDDLQYFMTEAELLFGEPVTT